MMNESCEVSEAVFISLVGVQEDVRAATLRQSVATFDGVAIIIPQSFVKIPNAPFSYWVTERCRAVMALHPPLQKTLGAAKQGLATGDDFRFLRLWWEAPPSTIIFVPLDITAQHSETVRKECINQIEGGKIWVPFAKGGEYSQFYADIYLMVNWARDGFEVKNFFNPLNGRLASRPQNTDCFFNVGLTWPLRTNGLSFRIMPAGCVFSHKGPALFANTRESLMSLLALLNTSAVEGIVHGLGVGRVEIQSYEVGTIQNIPIPIIHKDMAVLAERAYSAARATKPRSETSHVFVIPHDGYGRASLKIMALAEQLIVATAKTDLRTLRNDADVLAAASYGLNWQDLESLKKLPGVCAAANDAEAKDELDKITEADLENQMEEDDSCPVTTIHIASNVLSWLVGITYGRWDIRYATGEQAAPELPDSFVPLPVCPPGQLQNSQGLPARPEDVPAAYPIRIPWDGILVDDPNHPLDIERRVREVIEIIWSGKEGGPTAEAIEHEACEILGVKSLRDYFRKPAGFFADHLKRYSKSRRQAPIYWPLSTASGNYTLWIYYHRLTDQTLHTAIADFLDPKIQATAKTIDEARSKKRGAEVSELSDSLDELNQFREELERVIKLPWKPNLNDGVLITACPLWRLFRHGKWHKDLKACWEALSEGEYDWAHLAYSIWPDRVRDKCKADRSLAIAHNLEELCKPQHTPNKPKKTKK